MNRRRPHQRVVLRALAVLLAVATVLAGAGVAYVGHEAADRLVHPPRELHKHTPASRGLAFEPVALEAEDGVPLAAWWVPTPDAVGTVVFLHGYGASKTQGLSVAPFLHRAGFNVLALDLRGHGYSGGTHTTFGIEEVRDVRAAVDWLLARPDVDPARIALFGWSMGGATALLAAPQIPEVGAVVADSSFARLDTLVGRSLGALTGLPQWPFVPVILAWASAMTHYSAQDNRPEDAARELHRPLLLIQGLEDALAQPPDGEALARAAGDQATLWLVEAGHVDARRAYPAEYEQTVVGFLSDALGVATATAPGAPIV